VLLTERQAEQVELEWCLDYHLKYGPVTEAELRYHDLHIARLLDEEYGPGNHPVRGQ